MTHRRRGLWRGLSLCCGMAVGATVLLAADQGGVFSSRVEMVRIDALVTRDRKIVPNLGAADFEVFDNGVLQNVELLSYDQVPLNVVVALDISSSLTAERLAQLRNAGSSLAGILKTQDQAGFVTFSETVTLRSPLTPRLEDVRAAIGDTRPIAGTRLTALVDAAFAALLTAESDVGRALVVVFSDGVDTGSWLRSASVLEIAKRSDAVVYAVATHHVGRNDFLADLTHATGGTMTEVESTTDIGAAFLAILNEFRHRYLVSYAPRGVGADGWHAVEVRVKGRSAKVTARPGYWGGR